VGTSLAQTTQERRDQFHVLRLGEYLDSFNAAVVFFVEQARRGFSQQTGDPVAAQQLAWQALKSLRQQQASAFCLLRCLFDVDRGDAGAGTRGASDETLGGPEIRPHRWRMSRWGSDGKARRTFRL
jgi:hypothetical protein